MDLAQSKTRPVEQQEQIGRRASIIPERRDTRAPDLRPSGDMRSARRGDGGAEELMRTLGLLQKSGGQFQDYLQNKHAADEQDNIAQGAADQLTGHVDPVMEKKSAGYRNAVTKGRTMTEFSSASREFDEDLRGLIENQDDPSLDVRRQQVLERMEQFYHGFATDEETGEFKAFLQSPGAMRYLSEAITKSRPQFEAAAMERIETRFNTEALSHYSQNFVDQALANGTIDIAEARSILPETVPAEAVRKATVTALSNAAQTLKDQGRPIDGLKIYDSILGKPLPIVSSVPGAPEGSPEAPAGAPLAPTGRVSASALEAAVEHVESRGNANAVSPKGARGRMQTMPGTLRDPGFGIRPAKDNSDAELTRVGREYLAAMRKRYNGDLVSALAAYNAGPGKADEWQERFAGKSTAQKIASIPYKETRDYVQNVLARAGGGSAAAGTAGAVTAPDDPVEASPGFRLQRPNADPVTEYEQTASASLKAPIGLDQLNLSGDDIARLREERSQLAASARQQWTQKSEEDQEFNATSMALRLYGQGSPLTSSEITEGVRSGAIKPQAAMTLWGILRSNTNAAESYTDRTEARADRDERKAQEEAASAISGRYITGILSGRLTAPQARAQVLNELPGIRDPKVQAAVANSVLATAGDIEQLALNSAGTRSAVRRITDSRDHFLQRAGQGRTPSAAAKLAPQIDSLLDQATAEIATRVRDGAKPEDAEKEVMGRFKPKLDALTSPRVRK